jgi:hypothetical protein
MLSKILNYFNNKNEYKLDGIGEFELKYSMTYPRSPQRSKIEYSYYKIHFWVNGNNKRKYEVVVESTDESVQEYFKSTKEYGELETWVHTGMQPSFYKDTVMVMLSK